MEAAQGRKEEAVTRHFRLRGVAPSLMQRAPARIWAPGASPVCLSPTTPSARGSGPQKCGERCASGRTDASSKGPLGRRPPGVLWASRGPVVRRAALFIRRWRRSAPRCAPGGGQSAGGAGALAHALFPPSGEADGPVVCSPPCHRRRDAALRAQTLPLGAGGVEAAWKTLVRQRLKRAGRRGRHTGGQALLTCRAWYHSERFERAWPLLVRRYQRDVSLPQKVRALNKLR
jgi:hypothetical protein